MIVDWLSFTVEIKPSEDYHDGMNYMRHELWHMIREQNPILARAIERMPELVPGSGRAPYNVSWHSKGGVTVFANPKLPHALVEFSGKGCQWLRDVDMLRGILAFSEERITRLDIALDLPGLTPDEIVSMGVSGRFRAKSDVQSETGHTKYIGSTKSDRYCRVYRYNPPHPRSNLCRIEAVHRSSHAREVARRIMDTNIETAGRECLATYKFDHPDVVAVVDGAEPPKTTPVEKTLAKTERWLIAQAAPAFRKLVMNGGIEDPVKWLNEHFLQNPDE